MVNKFFYTHCKRLSVLAVLLILGLGLSGIAVAQDYSYGDIPLDPETYQQYLKIYPSEMREALPASYDARNDGIVTPAKNQGACGSCWAFASVGAVESHLLKKWGYGPTDLSEQQQLVCNTSMWGCSGGNSSAIRFWETRGPITEDCFPYTANDNDPCDYTCAEMVTRVIDWHTVPTTTTDFKTSLYNEGPSYWRFTVYTDFNTYWDYGSAGEVYVNTGGSVAGGHAVLLIGWDDSKNALLCKNSWGETAGPNGDGTFWIAYSGHLNNLGFGMANFDLVNEPDDYDYCFNPTSSTATYEFNKNDMWLQGDTEGASCEGDNPLVGWVYGGGWVIARDTPTGSGCYETVFYWGDMTKDYDWTNSNQGTGIGTLVPCASAGASAGDDAAGGSDVLEGGTYCLVDDWGNQYNLSTSGMYIYGTATHTSCGTCVLTGMVKGNLFSMYVDIPSGTSGCDEGYVVVASKSSKNGKWHNATNTGNGAIHFSGCASGPQAAPESGKAPGVN